VKAFAWLLYEAMVLNTDTETGVNLKAIASSLTDKRTLLSHGCHDVRVLGQRIDKVLRLQASNSHLNLSLTPGGRHDNDFEDFRKISILPTSDELLCKERPFYQRADAVTNSRLEDRPAIHFDNQFRLLREDMLGDLRVDLNVAMGQTKVKRRVVKLGNLYLDGLSLGETKKRKQTAFKFSCANGIPQLASLKTAEERKNYLNEHRGFLKHQSFGCLLNNTQVIAFARLERDVESLAKDKPIVCLTVSHENFLAKAVIEDLARQPLEFVLVDTPIFAYEPILKGLQKKMDSEMVEQLLATEFDQPIPRSSLDFGHIVGKVKESQGKHLESFLSLPKKIDLDASQLASLVTGLNMSISLVQGPPGTGKSFIGALLAKIIYELSNENITVLSYTNHALDQFMEGLIDIGIPKTSMLRLGSKSTARTQDLSLYKQQRGRLTAQQHSILDQLDSELDDLKEELDQKFGRLVHSQVGDHDIMEYLEFAEAESLFFDALTVPLMEDGVQIVDARGKAIRSNYLLDRWCRGQNAGAFETMVKPCFREVWAMETQLRNQHRQRWRLDILQERGATITQLIQQFDRKQIKVQDVRKMGTNELIRQKRIVGCTTTGAAMFKEELQSASSGVIIIEEAGEISESHILTAMTDCTKQLILIGDHKQLRPKISNYQLTVERGLGYDLNRSLFERLILAGFPHETLSKQHRMPPEISAIVKQLTYPELEDAPSTLNRPPMRGFQDRVIFFNHDYPEQLEQNAVADRMDQGSETSKRNIFEADIVLKCVRYLAQQGYGTNQIVILTPYLGQLFLLKNMLSKDNDPVLNDLDSFELIRAGLITAASAAHNKRPIKLSTIGKLSL